MTIDTRADAKELEAAGVERQAAEVHAEALTHHVLPDLITKADLAVTKTDLAACRIRFIGGWENG